MQVTLIDTTFATPAVDPRVTERYTAGPLSSSALPPSLTTYPPGTTETAFAMHPAATAVACVALVASIAIAAALVRRSQRIPVTAPQLV